ncbi:MAG: hypothetical protein VB674_03000 [Vicinamibacterales bacterium]
MPRIYVLHENDAWVEPLREALNERRLPFEEWFLDNGVIDFREPPPDGIFYNRMSASSHTRDHRYGPEYTAAVLSWLEQHGRRVLNPSAALRLEVSKIKQYSALNCYGIKTPPTVAAVGRKALVTAGRRMDPPFITKHNRAGKGLGVRLFQAYDAFEDYVSSDAFEPSIDGITLVQDYIQSPEPFITRAEFIGGRFFYAVRVDTSSGFELCPADACRTEQEDAFCPTGESDGAPGRFQILNSDERPPQALLSAYEKFLKGSQIDIAGIEFIVDRNGEAWTYDVNTNTNYNSDAEATVGRFGMGAIAEYLGNELAALMSTAATA